MAGSVNRVMLIGNLCADPDVKKNRNGDPIVNLRVATSESWRDKQTGDRKEKSEFHNVVIFNEGIAKVAEQYLRKGMKVYIEGQLQTRKWTDQQGQDRYATEVVLQKFRGELQMLESRNRDGDGDRGGGRRDDRRDDDRGRSNQSSGGGGYRDLDEDIPFAPEWR